MSKFATADVTGQRLPRPRIEEAPRNSLAQRLGLRASVWVRKYQLDARIAGGQDRAADPALALRGRQLLTRREREKVAEGLDHSLAREFRGRGMTAAIPVDRAAVSIARPALLQLIAALREGEPVDAQGVALAVKLLTDPASPMFLPRDREELYGAAREALLALRPG